MPSGRARQNLVVGTPRFLAVLRIYIGFVNRRSEPGIWKDNKVTEGRG